MTEPARLARSNLQVALVVLGVLLWVPASAVILAASIKTGAARASVGPPPQELSGEEVTIASPYCPGRLAGWYFKGQPGRGAVLLLHGYRANRKSQINRIRLLRASGFSILAIDFRAHGESAGTLITLGDMESQDVVASLRWLKEHAHNERIGVIGTSMGGAAAILAGPELNADAVVVEQVYSDIFTAVGNRLAMRLGEGSRILAAPLLRLASLFAPINPERLNLAQAIARVRAPILVIAGIEDRHATLAESERLFERAGQPKEIWKVEGVAHVDLATAVPIEYKTHAIGFITRAFDAATR